MARKPRPPLNVTVIPVETSEPERTRIWNEIARILYASSPEPGADDPAEGSNQETGKSDKPATR